LPRQLQVNLVANIQGECEVDDDRERGTPPVGSGSGMILPGGGIAPERRDAHRCRSRGGRSWATVPESAPEPSATESAASSISQASSVPDGWSTVVMSRGRSF